MPLTKPTSAVRYAKTKAIFDVAVELEGAAREAYVRSAVAGDSELAAEVERLLALDAEVGSLLESPWVGDRAAAAEELPQCQPGEMISGRFRVKRLLGHGGMGQVYEAHDAELGVAVALKTIRPEIAGNPEMLERFRREVRLARRITHANVCRTFDLQREVRPADPATGRPVELTYLTMEYLEGESLRELLQRKGRLEATEALEIARQMALGLAAAHETGVVHRDIKPANVMIVPRGEGCRVAITDFGLARFDAPGGGGGDLSAISQSGRMMGTLAYMAPEQLEGGPATVASDVYAFGLVLYEMVTGVKAFPETLLPGGAWRRLAGPPASPRTVVADVGARWEKTILWCLQVRPEDRPQSVEAVMVQLAGEARSSALWSGKLQGYAVTGGGARKTWRWWGMAACVGLVCVSLLVWGLRLYSTRPDAKVKQGALVYLAGIRNETGERSLDNLDELMRGQLAQSTQFNLLDRSTVADMLQTMAKDPNTPLDVTTMREIAMRSNAASLVRGTIARAGSRAEDGYTLEIVVEEPDNRPDRARHRWRHQWSWTAGDARGKAGEIPAAVMGAVRDAGTWVRRETGEAGNDLARLDAPPQDVTTSSWDALAEYTHAQELASRNDDEGAVTALRNAVRLDPGFALAYARLGDILTAEKKMKEGYEAYNLALSAGLERRLTRRERDRIKGMYAYDTRDMQAADQAFRDYNFYYEYDPTGFEYRSGALKHLGRTEEAIEALRTVVELRPRKEFGLVELVRCLLIVERYDEAREAMERVRGAGYAGSATELEGELEFLTEHLDEAQLSFQALAQSKELRLRPSGSRLQARVAAERGEYHQAFHLSTEQIHAESMTGPASLRASLLLDRSSMRVKLADYSGLLEDVRQALALNPSPQNTIAASSVLGVAFAQAPAQQRRGLRERLEELERRLPPASQDVGLVSELARLRVQGEVRLARGDWKGAIGLFRKAAAQDYPADDHEYLGRALEAGAAHQYDPVAARRMEQDALQAYGAMALRPGYVWQGALEKAPGFYADEAMAYLRLAARSGSLDETMKPVVERARLLRAKEFSAVPGLSEFVRGDAVHAGQPNNKE